MSIIRFGQRLIILDPWLLLIGICRVTANKYAAVYTMRYTPAKRHQKDQVTMR